MTTPPPRKRGRPKNNSTSPQAIQMIEDIEKAWQLRKQGKSYREIGSVLGVTHITAFNYVRKKIEHYEDLTQSYRVEYQQTQLDDINRAIELIWKQIAVLNNVNQKEAKGVMDNVQLARARADSIKTLNSLLDRQAKLLGLDEPTKIESQSKDVLFVMDLGSTPNDPTND